MWFIGSSTVEKEVLDRWKYLITGLVALTAVSIVAVAVAVHMTNRASVGELSDQVESRLENALQEISSNIDPSVDPCDDFYEYACGSFSKRHPIPENKTEVSYHTLYSAQVYRTIVDRLQRDQLKSKDTIEPLKYLKRVWDSCVNDDSSTSQQTQKLMQYFEELDRLSWQDQLARLIKDGFDVLREDTRPDQSAQSSWNNAPLRQEEATEIEILDEGGRQDTLNVQSRVEVIPPMKFATRKGVQKVTCEVEIARRRAPTHADVSADEIHRRVQVARLFHSSTTM